MAATYYESVSGITDGMTYYEPGVLFVGTPTLDAHFEESGGKQGDRVLYKTASKAAYQTYMHDREVALVEGTPRRIVGFEPTGEESHVETQLEAGSDKRVKADAEVGKPSDGDPLPPDSPEAERRLQLSPEGNKGGAGAPATKR